MIQVRKACLITLERLRMKSQANNITYLKSKNILPLFYYFLQDPAQEMRTVIYLKFLSNRNRWLFNQFIHLDLKVN